MNTYRMCIAQWVLTNLYIYATISLTIFNTRESPFKPTSNQSPTPLSPRQPLIWWLWLRISFAYYKIIQHIFLCVRLYSRSIFLRFIHNTEFIIKTFLLWMNYIPLHKCTTVCLSIQVLDMWVVFSLGLLRIKLLYWCLLRTDVFILLG